MKRLVFGCVAGTIFAVAATAQVNGVEFNDSHFHLTNYIQKGTDIRDLFCGSWKTGSKMRPARTVLTAQGSLRRATHPRALVCSAPFRPSNLCDGRLRREHFTILSSAAKQRKSPVSSSLGKKPG